VPLPFHRFPIGRSAEPRQRGRSPSGRICLKESRLKKAPPGNRLVIGAPLPFPITLAIPCRESKRLELPNSGRAGG